MRAHVGKSSKKKGGVVQRETTEGQSTQEGYWERTSEGRVISAEVRIRKASPSEKGERHEPVGNGAFKLVASCRRQDN